MADHDSSHSCAVLQYVVLALLPTGHVAYAFGTPSGRPFSSRDAATCAIDSLVQRAIDKGIAAHFVYVPQLIRETPSY